MIMVAKGLKVKISKRRDGLSLAILLVVDVPNGW